MLKSILAVLAAGLFSLNVSAQIVDVESTSEGVILPRVTNVTNVTSPALGMIVYQTSDPKGLYQYDGTTWSQVGGAGGVDPILFFSRGWIFDASSERFFMMGSGFTSNELGSTYHVPRDGVLTNFSIRPQSTIASGATARFTVRVSSSPAVALSDTNLELEFTSADGTSLKEDTDTFAVNKGDLITVRSLEVSNQNPGGNHFYSIWLELQ